MSAKKILVFGATGNVGSGVVQGLRERGHQVVAATSKVPATDSPVPQVQVNLASGEGLNAALSGMDRAFLMSPPGHADMYGVLAPAIETARARGLEKVVLMTAMGANADPNTPFRRAERLLESSGMAYNIIRPNWFMQNFNSFWIQGIREQGRILLPAGDAKVSFIDTADISAVATGLLDGDALSNRDFDLTGPRAVDHAEVAQALSAATGRDIGYQEIPPEALRAGLLGAGLPADYTEFLLMIFDFLRQGYNAGVTDHVQQVIGRAPADIEDYARRYRDAWM